MNNYYARQLDLVKTENKLKGAQVTVVFNCADARTQHLTINEESSSEVIKFLTSLNLETTEERAQKGRSIAMLLGLKVITGYTEPRYMTIWGDKTALGLYLYIERIALENVRV